MERRAIDQRTGGAAAIAFAATVLAANIVENAVAARPEPGASASEVRAWAVDAGPQLWVSTLTIPLSALLLFTFGSTVLHRVRRAGSDDRAAIVGIAAMAMLFGTISAAFAVDAVLIARVDLLSDELVLVLNDISTALFVFNWATLAVALWAFGLAARSTGLIGGRMRTLTVIGAVGLAIGSTQIAAALDGVLVGLLFGLAGFACWLTFLVVVGIRLIRPGRDRPSVEVDDLGVSPPVGVLAELPT